jgi:hypothetical protein
LPPRRPTLEDVGIAICNGYGSDTDCMEGKGTKTDNYRSKAKPICKDFVRKYMGSIAVVSTASCLVAEEEKCGAKTCCNDRATCRLAAHVKCYAKMGFIPFLGLPEGGAEVGWNDLLGELVR